MSVSATDIEELSYTIPQAARMAGFPSAGALRVYLHRHKDEFPRKVRDKKFDKRQPRLIPLSHIRVLTERSVK